jgi:hypothetical protein
LRCHMNDIKTIILVLRDALHGRKIKNIRHIVQQQKR